MSQGRSRKKKHGKRPAQKGKPLTKLESLCDINLPKEICMQVNAIPGYKTHRLQELGFDTAWDSGRIKVEAIKRKALVLTFDEDFLDPVNFKICTHLGVLRLAMTSQASSYVLPRLKQFLWSSSYKWCRHANVELRDQFAIVRSKAGLQRPIRY